MTGTVWNNKIFQDIDRTHLIKKPKRSVKQQNRKYTNKRTKNDDEEVTDDEGATSLIQLHYSFIRSLMCCNLLYLPFDLSYFVEWTARKKRKLFNAKLLPKEYKYLDREAKPRFVRLGALLMPQPGREEAKPRLRTGHVRRGCRTCVGGSLWA